MRLMAFHRALFGPNKLRWRSYDQKPLWFNAVGGTKTLACKGAEDVEVRENCHATRARFTAMTKCVDRLPSVSPMEAYARSHGSARPHRLAVLFKAEGDGSRIRRGLDIPEDTLLQFGPKGSYRKEHVLEFLDWDLGRT